MWPRLLHKRTGSAIRRSVWLILIAGCVSACTTKYGTIAVSDRWVPSERAIERLRQVSGVAQEGGLLWAKPAERALYEQARQEALKDTGGNVLLDVQVTTRLIAYLWVYYVTSVTVEGTAAKMTDRPVAQPTSK